MKKPWLAAILNFVVPGIGYLYIETKSVFGWLLVASSVLGFIAGFDAVAAEHLIALFTQPFLLLAVLVACVAFVVDAYHRAQQFNVAHQKSDKKE